MPKRLGAYTEDTMAEIWRYGDEDLHVPDADFPRFLTGHFLISSVHLVDPNFYRTVVLLVQHAEDGAFGLVVNRSSDRTLSSVIPEAGEGLDAPLYIGGPVQQDYLFALHGGLPSKVQARERGELRSRGLLRARHQGPALLLRGRVAGSTGRGKAEDPDVRWLRGLVAGPARARTAGTFLVRAQGAGRPRLPSRPGGGSGGTRSARRANTSASWRKPVRCLPLIKQTLLKRF